MTIPPGFELHAERVQRGTKRMENIVSISTNGIIGLSAEAHQLIGNAVRVEFLFDRDRKVLALRQAEGSPLAYKLREPSRTGYTSVFAQKVLKEYGISYKELRRYEPWQEDGLLCIDVSGAITRLPHQ